MKRMREILFRGKKPSTGDWLFGDIKHQRSGDVCIRDNDYPYVCIVDPETVGQYTGLKDEAGTVAEESDATEIG